MIEEIFSQIQLKEIVISVDYFKDRLTILLPRYSPLYPFPRLGKPDENQGGPYMGLET